MKKKNDIEDFETWDKICYSRDGENVSGDLIIEKLRI